MAQDETIDIVERINKFEGDWSEGELIYDAALDARDEIIKLRQQLAEQPTLSKSVDELAEFEKWIDDNFYSILHANGDTDYVITTDDIRSYWQAHANLSKPQPTPSKSAAFGYISSENIKNKTTFVLSKDKIYEKDAELSKKDWSKLNGNK